MRYNLKGTNLALTDEIRSYVEKKLENLDMLLRDSAAARADIELEYLRSEERMYRAELMLHDGAVLRAEARASTLHEAFDKAFGELRTELTRLKKKKIRVLRHGASRVKEFLRGWRKSL